MKLTQKQTQALQYLSDNTTTELIFGGGAGGGKSVLGCYWITKCCIKYAGTRWVIGRSQLKTLKETTLNSLWDVFQQQHIKPVAHYTFNETKNIIKFFNGSEILLKDLFAYPSDPNFDELGSLEITGAFVDECSGITQMAWNILKSRIRYRLDEYNLLPKILGSCNPDKGWVYQSFYAPHRDGKLATNKKFLQSLLDDNPNVSKHYRDNLLSLPKGSIERLLLGLWEWDSDERILVDIDAINDCFTNLHVKPSDDKRISADLAMQGRDKFIALMWRGDIVKVEIEKAKATGKEIETDLVMMMEMYSVPASKVIADSDGIGSYLDSYIKGIKRFHAGSTAINKETFANLKSECAYKLAEKINKRQLKIICSEQQRQLITEELGVLKASSVDNDTQKKSIIKKDEMKTLIGRSPDFLDALIMGMFFEIAKKQAVFIITGLS